MSLATALLYKYRDDCVSGKIKVELDSSGSQFIAVWDVTYSQPTDNEITEWAAAHESMRYKKLRRAEYPSLEECIHAILDDELDTLQVARQAVKDKYPKGEA
jgi:hypothetical protein